MTPTDRPAVVRKSGSLEALPHGLPRLPDQKHGVHDVQWKGERHKAEHDTAEKSVEHRRGRPAQLTPMRV